jgi:hypothetical protein
VNSPGRDLGLAARAGLLQHRDLLLRGDETLNTARRAAYYQCSNLICRVHRSHRWKVHRDHRHGVTWHPLP